MDPNKNIILFSGRANPVLSQEIAAQLKVDLGQVSIEDFPDGEIGVQIKENVRGRDVFVVQSLARQPNFYLMELLILIDALKRASARNIIAILPYYCYARQDRKDKGRMPITARLVADLLEKVGVTGLLTMDLHTEQIQGFFDIPVDNLKARAALVKAIKAYGIADCVVVTPDIGSVKLGREFSSDLGTDLAVVNKRRLDAENVEANALIGSVQGKDVLIVDDIYSTGRTLKKAAKVCKALGAKRVFGAITHGLMLEDIEKESEIEKLFITNTVQQLPKGHSSKVQVVSVASVFAQAIERIVEGRSVSSLSP